MLVQLCRTRQLRSEKRSEFLNDRNYFPTILPTFENVGMNVGVNVGINGRFRSLIDDRNYFPTLIPIILYDSIKTVQSCIIKYFFSRVGRVPDGPVARMMLL